MSVTQTQGVTASNNVTGGTVSTPQVTVTVSAGLVLTNQGSGAAAQLATLTNGPVAGDPAIWIPIRVNGTIRYIPAW